LSVVSCQVLIINHLHRHSIYTNWQKNGTNEPSVETRFIASSSPKDVLQSLIELVLIFVGLVCAYTEKIKCI